MTSMLKLGVREKMDLTCFENILMGGSVVQQQLVNDIKVCTKTTTKQIVVVSVVGNVRRV